jgi:RHS repeat-associated protein
MSAVQHRESAFGPPPLWAENRVWASSPENRALVGASCSVSSTLLWSSWQVYDGTASGRLVGLDFFGARYLSSAQGRFTSPDAPFNDQDPSNPQSWNLYSYGRNNPLAFIDPDGTTTCDANGNNCHDDVTVSGDSDPVDYVWSFLQSAGSQAVQNAVAATNTALTSINNFRNNPNCASALTLGGVAAGAGIGAYVGGSAGGAAGFVGGSVVPVAGNAAGLVGGAALGSTGGALAGGSLGGALGGLAGAVFCSSSAGGPGGGGGGSDLSGSARKKLGNLASRAGEKVRDVIRSRGGTASNVNQAGNWADKTLGEAAQAAANGDSAAETAVKVAKQAGRLGQKY